MAASAAAVHSGVAKSNQGFDDPLRQNAAHDRPQHDADRERQREQTNIEGALILGREIGYGGLGDRLAAGHEA